MVLTRRDTALLVAGVAAVLTIPVMAVVAGQFGTALLPLPSWVAYLGTGAYAAWRQPHHRAARRMLLWGTLMTVAYAAGASYSAWVALNGVPSWAWLALLGLESLMWLGNAAALGMFVVFPDGSYRSAVDRWVVRVVLLALPVLVLAQLLGRRTIGTGDLVWDDFASGENPFARSSLSLPGAVGDGVIRVGLPFILLAGAVLLLVRRRRSGSRERAQIAWPLFGIGATAVCGLALGVLNALTAPWPTWVQVVAYAPLVLLVPVCVLIGMIRHELLDIRIVVRRSLLYGALWVAITAAYVGLAGLVGVVAGSRLPLAMAVATTVLVTFLAAPARRRLEHVADRLVFGKRIDRDQLVGEVGRQLAGGSTPDDATEAVAEAVRQGVRAEWVRVRLGPHEATASTGRGVPGSGAAAGLLLPLVLDDACLGEITCGPKEDGSYSERDRLLLETLGRQAAWAARHAELTSALTTKVGELEASRTRLLHAEEAGRRQLERDLHDGVQQELVGLLTRLGLVANQLKRDPTMAARTLAEAHADARRALEDLQELVRGIHPAILTDRGLVPAVEERAARMPLAVRVISDPVTRLTRLAADVESCAYFVVSECLTNVVKHSRAVNAGVTFSGSPPCLRIEVCDDGIGFDPSTVPMNGSGLAGLRDRVETLAGAFRVTSTPGSGTIVRVELPTSGARK